MYFNIIYYFSINFLCLYCNFIAMNFSEEEKVRLWAERHKQLLSQLHIILLYCVDWSNGSQKEEGILILLRFKFLQQKSLELTSISLGIIELWTNSTNRGHAVVTTSTIGNN